MSVEKDPWLQQALRHAPDHDVAVPEAVRNTILNAARAAVRRPEPAKTPWWQRWLAPLMQPARLGYSGAFMALLVVGLWGLDRLDSPTVAPEQAPALAVPATAAPASPEPAGTATSASPAKRPQAAAVADHRAVKKPESTEQRRMAAAAKTQADALSKRLEREEAEAPPAAAAPTQAAALAPVATAAPASLTDPGVDATSLARAMPRKAAPSLAARDGAAANAAEPANPLAAMLSALHSADSVRWQTAQAQGEHGLEQDQWLARLLQANTGPWQPAAAPPESPPTVQWTGHDAGQLWLQPDGQLWLVWRGQAHGAHLPPTEATTLMAHLAQWH